jgi:hypothetical protein
MSLSGKGSNPHSKAVGDEQSIDWCTTHQTSNFSLNLNSILSNFQLPLNLQNTADF